jgi:hypothetical protein
MSSTPFFCPNDFLKPFFCFKIKKRWTEGMAQAVELPPSKLKVLSSIHSTAPPQI